MRDPFNIIVAGVGGQGNLVCGRVLADATMRHGLRPVVGDTFGASRRGGSVFTHLRIGTSDWAPVISVGETDLILGLEPMETLRAAQEFAGQRTVVLTSLSKIPPVVANREEAEYPPIEKIIEALERSCRQVYAFDTDTVLNEMGTKRVLNAFMLGTFAAIKESPFVEETIRASFKLLLGEEPRNLQAFELGVTECRRLYR